MSVQHNGGAYNGSGVHAGDQQAGVRRHANPPQLLCFRQSISAADSPAGIVWITQNTNHILDCLDYWIGRNVNPTPQKTASRPPALRERIAASALAPNTANSGELVGQLFLRARRPPTQAGYRGMRSISTPGCTTSRVRVPALERAPNTPHTDAPTRAHACALLKRVPQRQLAAPLLNAAALPQRPGRQGPTPSRRRITRATWRPSGQSSPRPRPR